MCNAAFQLWPVASLNAAQRSGRFRRISGHHADIVNRTRLTHSYTLRPPIAALRKVCSIASSASASSLLPACASAALATIGSLRTEGRERATQWLAGNHHEAREWLT